MKTTIITLTLIAFNLGSVFSQENIINKRFSINSQYQFIKFTDATIKFNDGYRLTTKLNYNVVLEKMQFIEDNKVKNLENTDVKYIRINDFTYIPVKGKYYQQLFRNDYFRLLLLKKPDLTNLNSVHGGYNTSTETSSANRLNSVQVESGRNNDLCVVIKNDDAEEIKISSQYFVLNTKEKLIPLTKKKIYKLSSKSKESINNFIVNNNINLNEPSDLIKLLNFLH